MYRPLPGTASTQPLTSPAPTTPTTPFNRGEPPAKPAQVAVEATSADAVSLLNTIKFIANYVINTVTTGLFDAQNAFQPRLEALAAHLSQDLSSHINDWASNLGVVDGSHTASGKPLLANDPHLGLSAPAIWYFARLKAPGIDVTGATLPGLPFVVLGRTARVAWGFTNTGPDMQDLYLEQINPVNPLQYRVPALSPADSAPAWAAFNSRQETIAVKGTPDGRCRTGMTALSNC